MASNSSKALPFIVLAITFFIAVVEVQTGRNIDISALVPILVAIGVAGVPLAAVKSVAENVGAAKQVVQNTMANNTPPPAPTVVVQTQPVPTVTTTSSTVTPPPIPSTTGTSAQPIQQPTTTSSS